METETTREPQYQDCVSLKEQAGLTPLGLMANFGWRYDPRRLTFTLSRYKFVSKMLSGFERVLEVGCADAFGTRVVQQEAGRVTAVDFDPVFVRDVQARMDPHWPLECFVHDILAGPVPGEFDGVYALDVLEHIPPEEEQRCLTHLAASLTEHGVLIIGMPSLQSQQYASAVSKAGHVNCKEAPQLKALMAQYFHNVFMFSMNDEVVHTGYYPMAQYLFAISVGKRAA